MNGDAQSAGVITLIMCLVCIYAYIAFTEVTYVNSVIDHREYLVRNLPDKKEAADLLARLNGKLKEYLKTLSATHPTDARVKRLCDRCKYTELSESTSRSMYTSYTVNKGSKVVMCVRQRQDNDKLVDMNTLIFVALHEMAHIMTVSRGHTQEFWDNFRFILQCAVKQGVYNYHPYHVNPQSYCGTMISDTPLRL